jgi:hypothetical protein
MLEKWFEAIRASVEKAETAGDSIGACFLQDPTGGPSICVQVDEATCKALKGIFTGGPCPGLETRETALNPDNVGANHSQPGQMD